MLRRSLCCQHNKLVFSRANWYNIALRAVLPERTCVQRAIQFQCSRATATMAATALDDVKQDMASDIQQLPPLEPLTKAKKRADITTVKSTSSASHFKRCSGYKTRKGGGQCTRLVKISLEQAEDKVYCYNHKLKPQDEKHLPVDTKKAALCQHPTDHAKDKGKQPVDRLGQEELQQLVDNIHNHDQSVKAQGEKHPPAMVKKAKPRRRRVDHAKEEKETAEQPVSRPAQVDLQPSTDTAASLTIQKKEPASVLVEKVSLPSYSFHHANENEMMAPSSTIYDCWQLWIGNHIEPKSKALIRQVMKNPISDRDKAGYIYGFLLEDGPRVSQVEHAYFKVGRAENPHRRMYQVTRSCNFIPKIVEVIPNFPEKPSAQDKPWIAPANEVDVDTSDIDNDDNAIEAKCPMSHRVERLIHLELASQYQRAGFKCDECGSIHREWFKVDRRRHPNGTLMTDQELWHSDIRPIVLKWIQFGVVATALKS